MMAEAQTFIPVRIARAKKPQTFIPVRIAPAMCQNSNESAGAPRARIRGKPRRSPVEATAEAKADAKADAMAKAKAEAKKRRQRRRQRKRRKRRGRRSTDGGRTLQLKAEPSTRLRKNTYVGLITGGPLFI